MRIKFGEVIEIQVKNNINIFSDLSQPAHVSLWQGWKLRKEARDGESEADLIT